jgi:hypothetical protein
MSPAHRVSERGPASVSSGPSSRSLGLIVGGVACLLLVAGARADDAFAARLTTVPVDVLTRAAVTGIGSASARLNGHSLTVSGSFEGLRAPATIAALHEGPVTGVRGPAIYALQISSGTSGSFSGRVTLSEAQIDSLRHGRLYVQVHSRSAPEGNLWGWLLPGGGPARRAGAR